MHATGIALFALILFGCFLFCSPLEKGPVGHIQFFLIVILLSLSLSLSLGEKWREGVRGMGMEVGGGGGGLGKRQNNTKSRETLRSSQV